MEEEIVLTSRDFEVFKLVNKFGLIEKKVLYKYFCDSIIDVRNASFLKRLRKLKRNGYLKSYTKSYGLVYKEKSELILRGINMEYSEYIRKEYVTKTFLATQIILDLNYKSKMSRIEFINDEKKNDHNLQPVKLFAGVVWNRIDKKYLVYSIDKLNKGDCERIRKDLVNSTIKNVILITKEFGEIIKLDSCLSKIPTKKILMIPNGENGYKLIEIYESQKLSNQNLVDYIKAASNQEIKIENEDIKYNDNFCTNQMLLDYKSLSYQLAILNSRNITSVAFIFEECYFDYFSQLKLADDSFENKFTISITLEKFLNFTETKILN